MYFAHVTAFHKFPPHCPCHWQHCWSETLTTDFITIWFFSGVYVDLHSTVKLPDELPGAATQGRR